MSKETQAEYEKRQLKRKAKALRDTTGMKYTEALRQVKTEFENCPKCVHCGEPISQNAPGHRWRHWGTYISCYGGDAITHATPKVKDEVDTDGE